MYNSYSISSSALSLRDSVGSLSFSFNDYSSNMLNSLLEKTPLCCSSCACCCTTPTFSNATHNLPITPCFLFGLRQSTFLQCSPYRRLILPAGYRCFLRFPSCDLDPASFEVSTATMLTTKTKGRLRCMVSEENSARCRLGGLDAAEAMISLLSEQVVGDQERNRSSFKIVEVDKRRIYDSKCYSQKKKREQVENARNFDNECQNGRKKRMQEKKRGTYAKECYKENNNNVGSGLLESASKDEYESIALESREESGRNAGSESSLRAENCRGRTKTSSCSSYYSLSSSGDLESDTELPELEDQILEESLSGHLMESVRIENSITKGQVSEGFKMDDAGSNSVDWSLRKKSEKKLAEVYAEQIQSGARTPQEYSRRVKNGESDYSYHEQLGDNEWQIKKQHTSTNYKVVGYSESGWRSQDVREISKIHVSDAGETSQKKLFTGGEANVKVSEIKDSAEKISSLQRLLESRAKNKEEDTTLAQSQSESRMKIWEEDTTMSQSSFQRTRKQHKQRGEGIIEQLELRKKTECLNKSNEAKNKKTLILQSETEKKKQDGTSSLSFTSNPDKKKECFPKDQKPPQRIESGKGLQPVMNLADNIELVTSSQTSSGKRLIEHESCFTSDLSLISDRNERNNETNGRVEQMKSRKENTKTSSVSSSCEETEEGSSFHASLNLVSEAGEKQFHVDAIESEKRSTEAVLMLPHSQAVVGGLLQGDSMTRYSTQEASFETSENGSATLYMHTRGRTTFAHHKPARSETYGESLNLTTNEDTLGYSKQMEKSSLQNVGEFVEKARHDTFISEVQQGKKSSDFNLAHEADKPVPKISGQYGKEKLKVKKHDSRQSSKGSGAEGPSDEMWDVTDPSAQEPPGAEIPQDTPTSEHAVINRTGRSLWSLMADVIRLRLGSRAQSPSSAARSGGRTSPNESVSSETWCSDHEPDEKSEENLRRERSSLASEVISYQLGQGTPSEGDVSDSMRSADKIRYLKGNISPSSNILETASTSEGVSLTSKKEKNDGSSFEVASSGKEVAQPSLLLPARSIRTSPVVEEIPETGPIGVMEQPFGARLTEASGSEGKDGELKQRKLQRTKQVPRDRFDEWEEAYTLESEQQKIDEMFMREALLEAKKAADSWEVPVGAVLVQHGKIISRGCNLVEELRDATAHAEMMCIREASSTLHSWRLSDTTLYVTLEPCPMCSGAILQARIDTLVWGAPNKLLGADGSWIRLFPDERAGNGSEVTDKPAAPVHPFHPKMTIRRGILASECADTMQQFFQLRRKSKEKKSEQPSPPSCLPITSHPSKFLTKMHDIFHIMFCL